MKSVSSATVAGVFALCFSGRHNVGGTVAPIHAAHLSLSDEWAIPRPFMDFLLSPTSAVLAYVYCETVGRACNGTFCTRRDSKAPFPHV